MCSIGVFNETICGSEWSIVKIWCIFEWKDDSSILSYFPVGFKHILSEKPPFKESYWLKFPRCIRSITLLKIGKLFLFDFICIIPPDCFCFLLLGKHTPHYFFFEELPDLFGEKLLIFCCVTFCVLYFWW